MALFRKFFHRKPPEGLFEISERVFVFNCCFTTTLLEGNDYQVYIRGIVDRLHEYFPDASFMVFNFGDGVQESQINNVLSNCGMTVIDYPSQCANFPLLTLEMIRNFLSSSENWLSIGQRNVLLMHCQNGDFPVVAFVLAAFLIYRNQSTGEQKTLEMVYKQVPQELLQLLPSLNPLPSQLRYLQYVSRRNVGSQWGSVDRALMLDCIILRAIPDIDGEGSCHPIFRIYGPDKMLFSMPQKSKDVKQEDCELVKIDINCRVRGDVVLEYISLDDNLGHEEVMFHVMFNSSFIQSNMLTLNRDEIDVLWNVKDRFPEDFRAEVHFSEMDSSSSLVGLDLAGIQDKEGLPIDACALSETPSTSSKSSLDTDCMTKKIESIELQVSVQRPAQSKIISPRISQTSLSNNPSYSSSFQGSTVALSRYRSSAPSVLGITALLHDHAEFNNKELSCSSIPESSISASPISSVSPPPEQNPSEKQYANFISGSRTFTPPPPPPPPPITVRTLTANQHIPKPSPSLPVSVPPAPPPPPNPSNRHLYASELSDSLSIEPVSSSVQLSRRQPPPSVSLLSSAVLFPPPPPPPPPPAPFSASTNSLSSNRNSFNIYHNGSLPNSEIICTPSVDVSPTTSADAVPCLPNTLSAYPPPPPPPPRIGTANPPFLPSVPSSLPLSSPFLTTTASHSPSIISSVTPPPFTASFPNLRDSPLASALPTPSIPPSPNVPIFQNPSATIPPPPTPLSRSSSSTISTCRSLAPPPPCPPSSVKKESPSRSRQVVPPPPAPLSDGLSKASCPSVQLHSSINTPLGAKGKVQLRTSTRIQSQSKKTSLKPYHWLKLTRAMQGSLWAEAQKPEEATKAPELDMSELESLFSATAPNSDYAGTTDKTNRRGSGGRLKPDKVHLIELRRAYNCEIMLTKVKVPLSDLMNSILTLDDSALDIDQVDNLIKFCPTKEEIELLKNYKGDKENLGKCEQFFLELMKVPRVESKLRVFSFKIQFFSQISELRNSLSIVNSASEEVRNSVKLKRVMQTILSLGNALNQGTARGSAVGFRLDSLLKLAETRARNNKMTLIHYLCKVLTAKLPEVLDFHKDLVSLEAATKIQLKYLAEEMQAITKGLEKVVQELTASENDGAVSEHFSKTLKEFLGSAEAEVRSLASLYSGVGRNADALAIYFGEDPARCPFEQVVSTLLNFVRMFYRAHEENIKQLEFEKKRAQREAENWKARSNAYRKDLDNENTMSEIQSHP